MEHYTVTGMSCAACSARVEKAVSARTGRDELLGQPADQFNGRRRLQPRRTRSSPPCRRRATARRSRARHRPSPGIAEQEDALADHETPVLKRRLIASLGFLIVLMYFSMGHMMWGWPLPSFFDGQPRRDGPDSAAADHRRHGHQPEILHQRLQVRCSTARRTWIRS